MHGGGADAYTTVDFLDQANFPVGSISKISWSLGNLFGKIFRSSTDKPGSVNHRKNRKISVTTGIMPPDSMLGHTSVGMRWPQRHATDYV